MAYNDMMQPSVPTDGEAASVWGLKGPARISCNLISALCVTGFVMLLLSSSQW